MSPRQLCVYMLMLLCMGAAGFFPHHTTGHNLLVLAVLLATAWHNSHTYLFIPTILVGAAWIIIWVLEWSYPPILHQRWLGVLLLLPALAAWILSYLKHRRQMKASQAE